MPIRPRILDANRILVVQNRLPFQSKRFRNFWAFDINGDGIVDFYFTAFTRPSSAAFGLGLYNVKEKSNRIVGGGYQKGGFPFCSALPAGVRIGGTSPNLISWGKLLSTSGSRWSGLWANHGKGFKHRYLGLKFYVNGKAHYGWARLTTDLDEKNFAVMTGYAYETIPNKPIITGKTHGGNEATLGRLAQGASGVSNRRKP